MNRTIQYAIHKDDGIVVSRVGHEIAWPVLDYEGMRPENNFTTRYHLDKFPVLSIGREYQRLKWTRKVPTDLKNRHRAFWGLKPVRITDTAEEKI